MITDLLKSRAARLWYHGATEIKMGEGDFVEAFVAGDLTASRADNGHVTWYYFGLIVVKDSQVSRGN